MKKHMFLLVMALLLAVFFTFSLTNPDSKSNDAYAEQEGELLVPQSNVAIAIVDLTNAGLSLTRMSDIPQMKALHEDFRQIPDVTKVESLINAFRVIAEEEEIIVKRVIPENIEELTNTYLLKLNSEMSDFPELTPYINKKHDTLIYYIYFANNTPSAEIYANLTNLQKKWKDRLYFDFTGRAPVIAATESLLTRDLEITFPILALMVICILLVFKSKKVIYVSLPLIMISMAVAYGFSHFLGLPDTQLVLLIPVFCLGLLSDYLIHFFYHSFHTPHMVKGKTLRQQLIFPLSLTAISTITGFLSLGLIKGSGHVQLGIIIATSIAVVWLGVFFWLNYQNFPQQTRDMFPQFQRIQTTFFTNIFKFRYLLFFALTVSVIWGALQLQNLVVEPYPISQLPETTTIQKADSKINEEFSGTLPFFIEIDTGKKNGILKKSTLQELQKIHKAMDDSSAGYAFSLLTVLKRMHYYFMGSEETLLSGTEFDDNYDALIEQYLLYFSSSVDPLEYEALLNNSYRIFSIKGLIYYENYNDLKRFSDLLTDLKKDMPEDWSLGFYGMAAELQTEHDNLRNNWIISFFTSAFLIFITVLLFYRKFNLAIISILPGIISMIISFGLINLAGISIDAFSIIFVAIITGLVVDYSIHTLAAIDRIEKVTNLQDSFREVIGYSGLPIFLSFITSLLSFMVLFLSSFSGARNLGFILITSLLLSFFLSLYLIPLIVLPIRLKKES
ncbi:MAG: efflux RND transporter permease subunit [Spirochaetes bacterium]|nr:efflux RND transporter permease subunit [Spirochaetota bacterium]